MHKRTAILFLATALAAGTALPLATQAAEGHNHAHAAGPQTTADGLIRKIDKKAGRVTISHGPLPNGMPAMTMVFQPKEADWINRMREGDKIRFTAEERNGVMLLTHFETAR